MVCVIICVKKVYLSYLDKCYVLLIQPVLLEHTHVLLINPLEYLDTCHLVCPGAPRASHMDKLLKHMAVNGKELHN